MAKTISYINNRIISNTGSVSTSIGINNSIREDVELTNSFSDINRYGFNFNDNTVAINDKDRYSSLALIKNNNLPPFEMELQFKEYYLDHVGTNYGQKIQKTPFSPLNTVFFAKSMSFSHDLKSAITKDQLSYFRDVYNYNNNDRKKYYFDNVLSVYKNIPPAILFASSLPIDTTKLIKLVYDDLKTPGMKQVPYTFALWLGSKWHYYKHSNEIFMGQNSWNIDYDYFLDKNLNLNDSKKYLTNAKNTSAGLPKNLTDLSSYVDTIPIFRDNTVGINYADYNKRVLIGKVKTEGVELINSSFELYKTHPTFVSDFSKDYQVTFAIPNSNNGNPLAVAALTGIGINNALLLKTYNFLEDATPGFGLDNIARLIGGSVIGNIRHYDYSNDNGNKQIQINAPFISRAKSSGMRLDSITYNKNAIATNKFDVIRKYYNGVSPWSLTLEHYPKFTDTRTVNINGIYSVTTPFILDNDGTVKKTNTIEKIFTTSKNSKITYTFYDAFRKYILYNVNLKDSVTNQTATINQHIENAYSKLEEKNNPRILINQISQSSFTLSDEVLLELILIILANVSNELGGVDNMLNMLTSFFAESRHLNRSAVKKLVTTIYNDRIRKFVGNNPEYTKLVTSVCAPKKVFEVNTDTQKIVEAQNVGSPMLVYPKLLMDIVHGFIEITSVSENDFYPLIRNYYNYVSFTNKHITTIKNNGVIQSDTNEFTNREATINTINFKQNSNTIGGTYVPITISINDFTFMFETGYVGYNIVMFAVLKIIEKIIQEQIASRVSIDYNFVSKYIDEDKFVAKLYPSAGGSLNLSYGLNTHIYTDVVTPKMDGLDNYADKRNVDVTVTRNHGIGVKYIYSKPTTVIDPRITRNHIVSDNIDFTKQILNSNKTIYTDSLLLGNLENIRNSCLRYLWYSGPYFGAQTAQLSLDKIIYSVNNIVDNTSDITTIPRTNYLYKNSHYAEVSNHLLNSYIENNNRVNELKIDPSKYDCYTDFGLSKTPDMTFGLQVGSTPNGYNLSKALSFDTIVKQLGSDMLNQFEGIFLDFCRPRKNNSSIIGFDEVMKLLLRVDNTDVNGDLYYPSFKNHLSIKKDVKGNTIIDENSLNTLSESDQNIILGLPPIESDVDLVNFVGTLASPGKHGVLKQTDYEKRVSLAYLKNITLTNAQHNRAKRVLNYLGSEKNDIYVKRNWIQNSADNQLVLFYTRNATELSTLKVANLGTNGKLVTKLYGKYITELFDENYTPSKSRIPSPFQPTGSPTIDLIHKAFQGVSYGSAQENNTNGYSYSYLENRAYSFMRLLIGAFNDDKDQEWLKSATTCTDIEFAIFNEMAKIKGGKFFNFYSNDNKVIPLLNNLKKTESRVLNFALSISKTAGENIFRKVITTTPDANVKNSEIGQNILFLYKTFLTQCFNILFDHGRNAPYLDLLTENSKVDKRPSQYLQTLFDELELLALNVIRENKPVNMVAFNTELMLAANNFLASSYQNTRKYFDKHMSTLLYVIEQSNLTANTEKGGLSVTDRNSISSEKLKIKPYYNIKKIHDTWLYSALSSRNNNGFYYISYYDEPCQVKDGKLSFSNMSDGKLFGHYFHIVDRGNNDLSNKLTIDPDFFLKYLLDSQGTKSGTGIEGTKVYLNTDNLEMSLYTFFGEIAKKHNSLFHALPSFNGVGLNGNIKGNNNLGDEMFQTYNYLKQKEAPGPHFIFQYIGSITSALDTKQSDRVKKNDYRNSFCLEDFDNLPKELTTEDSVTKPSTTGFIVQFGEQNQQIFNNLNMDQSEFSNTEEYFDVITNLTKNGNVKTVGNDLYKIYDARSYTATITSMGNMEIEPLMYFYLKSVPLFRGSYWITNVSHDISPNNITTTFKGVRQPIASVKPTNELFIQINKDFVKTLEANNSGQTSSASIDNTTKTVNFNTTPQKTNRITQTKAVKADGTLDKTVMISKYYNLSALSDGDSVYYKHTIREQNGYSINNIACNLTNLAVNVLDKIKEKYPFVNITNGFRTYKVNTNNSQHYRGEAADLQFVSKVSNKNILEVVNWIKDNLVYDQLIFEHKTNAVIHISYSNSGKQRMQYGTMPPGTSDVDFGVIKNYYQ